MVFRITYTIESRLAIDLILIRTRSYLNLLCSSSEVVGRPLAALLANDGARVFSADIDSIQVGPFLGTVNAVINPRI